MRHALGVFTALFATIAAGCIADPSIEESSSGLLECIRCGPDGRPVDGCSACPNAGSADQIAGQCDLDPTAYQAAQTQATAVRSTQEWKRCMQSVITEYCCVDPATFTAVVTLAGLQAGLTPPSTCAQQAAPVCGGGGANPGGGPSLSAREVTPNTAVSDQIALQGENDWYKINLAAGARLVVRLSGSCAQPNPTLDGVVGLYGSQLGALASTGTCSTSDTSVLQCVDAAKGTCDTLTEHVVAAAGWYYIRVSGYGSTIGPYTVNFDVPNAGVNPNPGVGLQAREVQPNAVVSDQIGVAGENDWYKINLAVGAKLRVQLSGACAQPNPTLDGVVGLYGSQLGALAATGTCSTSDANILQCVDQGRGVCDTLTEHTVTSAGWYYVRVSGYGSTIGPYTVNFVVQNAGVSPNPGASLQAREVTANAVVSEQIAVAGETDWYKINLAVGGRLTVRMQGCEAARTLDAKIGLYTPALQSLASAGTCSTSDTNVLQCVDTSSPCEVLAEHVATVAGWHYVRVNGYGTTIGAYTIKFEVPNGQNPGGGVVPGSAYSIQGTTLPCRSNRGADMACRGNVNRQILRGSDLRGKRLMTISWMMDGSVMDMANQGLEIEGYLIYSNGGRTGRVIEASRRRLDVFDTRGNLATGCQRSADGRAVTCTLRFDTDMTLQLPADGAGQREYFILEFVGRPPYSDNPSCGRYPHLVAPGNTYNVQGVSFGGYLQRHQWSNDRCEFNYTVTESRPDLDLAATITVQ